MKALRFGLHQLRNLRESLRHGRPPEYISSIAYAEQFNAKWHKVYDQMPSPCSPPINFGSIDVDLSRSLDDSFPEAGVLELEGGTLYGQAGWIFSKEGRLLSDHSWYGRHVKEIEGIPRVLPKGRRLQGLSLNLASDFAIGSYGHFFMDCISRFDLLEKAGFKLSDFNHVFCPKPPSETAQQFFDQLGIPLDKCIWADEFNHKSLRPEKLIAPSFPGARRHYPKWFPEYARRQFLPSPPEATRRLYISRAGCRRNVSNEEAIIDILKQYQFEIYDPSKQTNQPYDFSEAEVIVGPHGGGLTDLAFCQPGTKVLELIPTDHVHPYYYTLSCAAGLDYGYMVSPSLQERGEGAIGPSIFDFHVNEDFFEKALMKITAKS